jgi:RNA polymerase sigma-70 factor (ECF subfamily)
VDDRVEDLELTGFVREAARRARPALLKCGVRSAELEDCVQEVLIAVVQRWTQLRSYPSAARYGYLYAICRGTAVDWLRRARYTPALFAHGEAEHEPDPRQPSCPEREYLGLRVRSAIRAGLANCAPALRATFLLVCLAGHTEAETAALQGIPLGTVASRLRRVRRRLRNILLEKCAAREMKTPGINLRCSNDLERAASSSPFVSTGGSK